MERRSCNRRPRESKGIKFEQQYVSGPFGGGILFCYRLFFGNHLNASVKIARMEARVPESKCIDIACQRINRNYFNFNFNAWEWCVLLCSCVGGRKAYRLARQCIGSKQNKSNRQRCPLGSWAWTLHRT